MFVDNRAIDALSGVGRSLRQTAYLCWLLGLALNYCCLIVVSVMCEAVLDETNVRASHKTPIGGQISSYKAK